MYLMHIELSFAILAFTSRTLSGAGCFKIILVVK